MINMLTLIGLVLIPFAHLVGVDQAGLKEYLAFSLAAVIVGYALFTRGIKCVNNKWFLFVIGSMIISTAFVPPSGLVLGSTNPGGAFVFLSMNVDNLWNFKPIFLCLLYLLMASVIATSDIKLNDVMTAIAWTGFLMAIVVICQKFGFQQFWRVKDVSEIGVGARNLELTGFMAQYTLVAAFMAICFVSAMFLNNYLMMIVIAVATLLTGSHFAILSVCISYVIRFRGVTKYGVLAYIATILLVAIGVSHLVHFNDNGRYNVWSMILHDMTHPLFDLKMAQSQGFTGFGAGAFSVFFPIIHQSPWGKAHNEFLEFLFNNGIFGLIILCTAIWSMMSACFARLDETKFLLLSFVAVCVLSCGTFPLHLGWGQFYTAVIVGLIYSVIGKAENAKGLDIA